MATLQGHKYTPYTGISIARIKGALLRRLVLVGKPITPGHDPVIPYAWGPCRDGESLRAIRKLGWMALGVSKSYLFGLLERQGWSYTRQRLSESHWGDVIIAPHNQV